MPKGLCHVPGLAEWLALGVLRHRAASKRGEWTVPSRVRTTPTVPTLGIEEVEVQTVRYIEVVGEYEQPAAVDPPTCWVEGPSHQHRGLNGRREQARPRNGVAPQRE